MKEKNKPVKREIQLKDFSRLVKGLKIIDNKEALVGSIELHTSEGAIAKIRLHKDIY